MLNTDADDRVLGKFEEKGGGTVIRLEELEGGRDMKSAAGGTFSGSEDRIAICRCGAGFLGA